MHNKSSHWRKISSVSWWRHQIETFSALLAFVRGIHRSPVNSPHKRPVTRSFWCFLWSALWIIGWVNNREAGDLRRHRAHYDVIVMISISVFCIWIWCIHWWWPVFLYRFWIHASISNKLFPVVMIYKLSWRKEKMYLLYISNIVRQGD